MHLNHTSFEHKYSESVLRFAHKFRLLLLFRFSAFHSKAILILWSILSVRGGYLHHMNRTLTKDILCFDSVMHHVLHRNLIIMPVPLFVYSDEKKNKLCVQCSIHAATWLSFSITFQYWTFFEYTNEKLLSSINAHFSFLKINMRKTQNIHMNWINESN